MAGEVNTYINAAYDPDGTSPPPYERNTDDLVGHTPRNNPFYTLLKVGGVISLVVAALFGGRAWGRSEMTQPTTSGYDGFQIPDCELSDANEFHLTLNAVATQWNGDPYVTQWANYSITDETNKTKFCDPDLALGSAYLGDNLSRATSVARLKVGGVVCAIGTSTLIVSSDSHPRGRFPYGTGPAVAAYSTAAGGNAVRLRPGSACNSLEAT